MRIHFFVRTLNEASGGGSHYNSIAYIRALKKRGHSVSVHVFYPDGNAFPPDITPVVHQGFGRGHLGERTYLARLLKEYENEADIFFLYAVEFMWGGGLYRRTGGRIPVVVYMDACIASLRAMPTKGLAEWWYQYKRLPWDKLVGLKDARAIDRFLPCSPAIGDLYKRFGFPKDKFTVLPNIVPDTAAAPIREDKKETVVLYVGRLTHIKGVDLLVEAMSRLKQYGAQLVIVGDGDMRPNIEAQARRSGLAIDMPGWIREDELGPYYARADIFAQPTRCFDASPRTIVSALQWGLPVVVPNTGGAEWVAGEAGFVYDANDSDALTKVLGQLLGSAELRTQLASHARSEAARFEERAVYPYFEHILRTAMKRAHS